MTTGPCASARAAQLARRADRAPRRNLDIASARRAGRELAATAFSAAAATFTASANWLLLDSAITWCTAANASASVLGYELPAGRRSRGRP